MDLDTDLGLVISVVQCHGAHPLIDTIKSEYFAFNEELCRRCGCGCYVRYADEITEELRR
jgi:hypothetical protein